MKAFNKIITRKITKNKSRYLSILLIVLLGVAFYSGIKATSPNMEIAAKTYFDKQKLMDIEIISPLGFSEDDINLLKNIEGIEQVVPSYSTEVNVDLNIKKLTIKLFSYQDKINKPFLLEGKLPLGDNDCLVDAKLISQTDLKIGSTVTFSTPSNYMLKTNECRIVGVVNNPLFISLDRGVSVTSGNEINGFIMLNEKAFNLPSYTNVYLTVKNQENYSHFSTEYEDLITSITETVTKPNWYVFTLNSNAGFVSYKNDTERIASIGKVFPIVFFLVATLVSLTSMTRLIENDRTEIGTLTSLGYKQRSIYIEYLFYAVSASLIGSSLGILIGFQIFPRVIFSAYGILYNLPPLKVTFILKHALTATLIAVSLVGVTTLFVCISSFNETPANLMRPKAPISGKRILLEKLNFIWKHLNFNQKVAMRNLFRYKKRFFMTILGIIGCTGLLVTGFGLKDAIGTIIPKQFNEIRTYDLEIVLNEQYDQSLSQLLVDNKLNDTFYVYQTAIELNDTSPKHTYLVVIDNKAEMNQFLNLHQRIDKAQLTLNDNEVIITEKFANLINIKVGDQLTINTPSDQLVITVGGIAENYVYHYIYMSKQLYEKLTQKNLKPNTILAKYRGDETDLALNLMKDKQIKAIRFSSSIKSYFNDMIGALDFVVLILIISAELLAFIVLFSLTNINIDERMRELATIKVLGFYDLEVASYIYRENLLITLVGSLIGLIFGFFLEQFVITTAEVDMVMFSRQIKLQSFLYSILLTFLFALLVNLVTFFRLKRIKMIESLKNVE